MKILIFCRKFYFLELKKKVEYSFDVKKCVLSISVVFRAIPVLLGGFWSCFLRDTAYRHHEISQINCFGTFPAMAPETNIRPEYWDIAHPPHGNGCGECIGPISSWITSIVEIKVGSLHTRGYPLRTCKPIHLPSTACLFFRDQGGVKPV